MLSALDRSELEKNIEFAKVVVLPKLQYLHEPEVSARLMLTKPEDYILGQLFGFVLGGMNQYFRQTKHSIATKQETDEIMALLNNRISEFRQSIFTQA